VAQHGHRIVDVLDRLQEHDGVVAPGLAVVLHHPPLEMQVLGGVAQAGVLEGIGVGVDAQHALCAPGQHGGAVALAAGHVEHALADHPRRDPLVDGEVAAVPVVLGRDIGQRALAGEFQRWHAGGLIALQMG
jgi:hypothetical protein